MKQEKGIPKIIIVYELALGFFELVSSLGMLFFGKSLLGIYETLKSAELIEHPNDLFIQITEKLVSNLLSHRLYIILLLSLLGITKIITGIGLLYKKAWAEHLLILFLSFLILFDLYELAFHFSYFQALFLIINILIVFYLVRFKPVEYLRRLKNYFI